MADDFNNFDDIAEKMHAALSDLVKKTAFNAQRNIQVQIVNKHLVDTGFMLNSVYTVTKDGSSFQSDAKALPEVAPPENDLEAYVAVGANYAAYLEFGTRFMPAKPFFNPGLRKSNQTFQDALNKIEEMFKSGGS